MGIQIIANIDSNQQLLGRVSGFANFNPIASFPELVAGDAKVVDLFLTSLEGRLNMQDYALVRLGLGELNGRPSDGSYTLEGEQLDFDHTAAQLQTIITSEVAAATVKLVAPFVFVIDFDANGAQTLPTIDSTGLVPDSTVNVKRLIDGDGSTKERWILRIYRNPIALVSDFDALGDDGVRGVLELGTEGIYRLFEGGGVEASTTAELEVTDVNGDIQTLFQIPVTVRGEVLGEGVPAVVAFETLATVSEIESKFRKDNSVFVSTNGNDSTGARNRLDLPFLTVGAAETAAQSGDTIFVFPGNYSAEQIGGKDGVFYDFLPGAIGPIFDVQTAITIGGKGVCSNIANGGGTLNFSEMTALGNVESGFGEISIREFSGSLDILDGTVRILGSQTIPFIGAILISPEIGTTPNLFLENVRVRNTTQNGTILEIQDGWSGQLIARNCTFVATNAGATDGATIGIDVQGTVTGEIQLKDCTFVTAFTGGGDAHSIASTNAIDVQIQGTLNQTHAPDANVTLKGGASITDTNITA